MTEKSSIQLKNDGNIDDLVSVIENHSEINFRLEALYKLEQVNLSQNKSRNVKFLENLIISDESVQIRSKALEIVAKKFPDSALKVLKWIIENEKSIVLFSTILKTLSNINSALFNDLKEILLNRYVQHYELVKEEAQFMMDLELLYSESYNALEFGSLISEPKEGISVFEIFESITWFKTKEFYYLRIGNHLRILDLSFLKSKLSEIPASIGNLKKLKRLYLENHQLSALPSSMEKLTRLKLLSLNNNKFESIPKKPLSNLKKLNFLFLHNNSIKKITKSDLKFIKKRFTKIYEKMGIQKSNAKILSLIEIFKGEYPRCNGGNMLFMTNEEYPYVESWDFGNDENGYITVLGIALIQGDLLFDHICKLRCLEELTVLASNVKKIPKSIKNLKSLKWLDISHNEIEVFPKAMKILKKIRSIEFHNNKIKNIPNFFKKFKSLELFGLNKNNIKSEY